MKSKISGWKYYLPEEGESREDAQEILIHDWQHIIDAEAAAEHAAEDEWSNRDGWDAGIEAEPEIVVISPDGDESTFSITRETQIVHYATEVE